MAQALEYELFSSWALYMQSATTARCIDKKHLAALGTLLLDNTQPDTQRDSLERRCARRYAPR